MAATKSSKESDILEKFKVNTSDLRMDSLTLARFLRARDYDLDKAEDMLRKSIKWRIDNDIQKYLDWTPPPFIADDMIMRLCGKDFEGHPVFWIPMGRWHCRKWVEQGKQNEIIKFRFHVLEMFMNEIKKSNQNQMVALIGLEEMNYWKISHVETMQLLYQGFKDFEQNYPEIMKSFVVINAPWIFSIVFNFVKPILSAHTLSKLSIHGTDKKKWFPELKKIIPESCIPSEYL